MSFCNENQNILPTKPGTMPFGRKFNVAPALQNIRCDSVRKLLIPIIGPLPAPKSNAHQPLFINRRPDIKNPPCPIPFDDDKFPDIVTVSRVVSGASIDCDIDIPDTSIDGKSGVSNSSSSSYALKISVALILTVIFPFGFVRCCKRLSSCTRDNRSYSSRISCGVFVRCANSQPSVSSPFTPNES